MLSTSYSSAAKCRRAAVDPCDPSSEYSGVNPPAVDGKIMLVRKGDIIDVGMDWANWLAANRGKLKSSTWTKHSASPKDPVFSGAVTLVNADEGETLCLLDTTGAVVGDIYYLANAVVVEGIPGAFVIPDRTVTKVIHVRVTA